jgi:cysteine synthase A
MAKIDLTLYEDRLQRAVKQVRERNIIIPTYAQMKNPALVPAAIRNDLAKIGLWDLAPRNLFRITWHNQPISTGGGFGGVNYLELPTSLTGVEDHCPGW